MAEEKLPYADAINALGLVKRLATDHLYAEDMRKCFADAEGLIKFALAHYRESDADDALDLTPEEKGYFSIKPCPTPCGVSVTPDGRICIKPPSEMHSRILWKIQNVCEILFGGKAE